MDYCERVAIVVGGASGLGKACVQRLHHAGVRSVVLDMDRHAGNRLAEELGGETLFFPVDVGDIDSVEKAVQHTVSETGAIHICINCAGIAPPARVLARSGPMDMAVFQKVVQINLTGTMNVIRTVVKYLVNNPADNTGERGVVINTASIAAFEGQIGQAAYSASKAGVVGLTLPLAREFARWGIRFVAVAPGLFDTPMMAGLPEKVRVSLASSIPFPNRLGRPDEFSALVAHIIANPAINGTTIRIDGAFRMSA